MSNLVDRKYVWMIESRGCFGFLHKPAQAVFIIGNFSQQNLQCNLTIQFDVERQVNFAHPARAKFRKDSVV